MTPRRRLRFSIRTMLILVATVGVYFGSWQVFEERSLQEVREYANRDDTQAQNESSTIPFIVGTDESCIPLVSEFAATVPEYHRRYYVWAFGCVVKLPYELELPYILLTNKL